MAWSNKILNMAFVFYVDFVSYFCNVRPFAFIYKSKGTVISKFGSIIIYCCNERERDQKRTYE